MVRKYQKTSPRTIRATVPQLGLDQTGCRSPFFWANIFEKRWIYNMQDKNILCSIRVSFETKVLVFAWQFWTLVPLCTFISNPHCTIHSYVADRRVSEFWKDRIYSDYSRDSILCRNAERGSHYNSKYCKVYHNSS